MGTGWLPTRTLKDVVWGLNSLFGDLCDFEDPLNNAAAEEYATNKASFQRESEELYFLVCKTLVIIIIITIPQTTNKQHVYNEYISDHHRIISLHAYIYV